MKRIWCDTVEFFKSTFHIHRSYILQYIYAYISLYSPGSEYNKSKWGTCLQDDAVVRFNVSNITFSFNKNKNILINKNKNKKKTQSASIFVRLTLSQLSYVLNHRIQFSKLLYYSMRASSDSGPGRGGSLPIHHAANWGKDISVFRTVFEAGMQHFPTKIGFLFHKDEHGRTSYQIACKKYGNEQVEKILDGVALNTTTTATTTKEQHDIVVKSLMFAATEEIVHLDGLYILLRREPSVLQCQTATRRTIKNDEDGKDDEEEEGDKLWADSNSYPLDIWGSQINDNGRCTAIRRMGQPSLYHTYLLTCVLGYTIRVPFMPVNHHHQQQEQQQKAAHNASHLLSSCRALHLFIISCVESLFFVLGYSILQYVLNQSSCSARGKQF